MEAMHEAYTSKKLHIGPTDVFDGTDFSRSRNTTHNRTFDDIPGPTLHANADQKRYIVDPTENTVSWMDWNFSLGQTRDSGLSLWDIRFKGDRIIYELGLQEALAQYSGNDPLQASTAYLDSHWGIGNAILELAVEYECPNEGIRLNISMYQESVSIRPGPICIFGKIVEKEHHFLIPLTISTTANS